MADSAGAAGMGLGAKESGDLRIEGNLFVHDTAAVYLDTSPLYESERNLLRGNEIRLSDAGIVFHGGAARNRILANRFRDNGVPVRVEGRGDALDAEWRGNDFGDYAGYDLDGDGYGDVPYELRSLAEDLTARYPALAYFRGAPSMVLVEWVGRVVPLFAPRLLVRDPRPALGAAAGRDLDAH